MTQLVCTAACFCLLLTSLCAAQHPGADLASVPLVQFPKSPNVIDIRAEPYLAEGDGVTDDTASIQRALDDMMGSGKVLYFPEGTYLISKTLVWSKKNSAGREAWGFNYLQGVHPTKAILRLKDEVLIDESQPRAMMSCGGFGSADWFHNYIQGLTFDVGQKNPGAIALQFYSNNSGAVRNCRFVCQRSSSLIGLDLAYRDMNGPLLVSNCEFTGFKRGIVTGHAVNSQTLEHISLRVQTEAGITNEGQALSIRRLNSQNEVPALQTYGSCCVVESELIGTSQSKSKPAIINSNYGRIYLRDVTTKNYARALADIESPDLGAAYRLAASDQPATAGPTIVEYWSTKSNEVQQVAPSNWHIAVEEPPAPVESPVDKWANVDNYGADPTGQRDSSTAIQAAIDSGASTIFLPGSYALKTTVVIRGNARRLVGIGGWLDYRREAVPSLRIDDAEGSVSIEHIANVHGGVSINSPRTVFFQSVSDCDLTFTPQARGGRLFLEDFVTHNLAIHRTKVWARQLNVENEGTHVDNSGGQLWILGYKTERGGTLLTNRAGGQSEVLGGFSYTTTAGKLAPMFVNDQSSLFTFFTEVCFNGDPFQTILVEQGQDKQKTYMREQLSTTPYRNP